MIDGRMNNSNMRHSVHNAGRRQTGRRVIDSDSDDNDAAADPGQALPAAGASSPTAPPQARASLIPDLLLGIVPPLQSKLCSNGVVHKASAFTQFWPTTVCSH